MKKIVLIILVAVCIAASDKETPTVYLVGDSTMSDKNPKQYPETGWGMLFPDYFDTTKLKIINRAVGGRSTKSYVNEGRWDAVMSMVKEGDYVFIQFGHNDESKTDTSRGVTADVYRVNLVRYIRDTKSKKAIPVLLSPVSRRSFDSTGRFYDSHWAYGKAVRAVAAEEKVVFIDVQQKSEVMFRQLGAEQAKKLFLWASPSEWTNYPNGIKDDTHFSPLGAQTVCELVLQGIRENKLALQKYLKP
jgi:lysophospholipase L1-like esterase